MTGTRSDKTRAQVLKLIRYATNQGGIRPEEITAILCQSAAVTMKHLRHLADRERPMIRVLPDGRWVAIPLSERPPK